MTRIHWLKHAISIFLWSKYPGKNKIIVRYFSFYYFESNYSVSTTWIFNIPFYFSSNKWHPVNSCLSNPTRWDGALAKLRHKPSSLIFYYNNLIVFNCICSLTHFKNNLWSNLFTIAVNIFSNKFMLQGKLYLQHP